MELRINYTMASFGIRSVSIILYIHGYLITLKSLLYKNNAHDSSYLYKISKAYTYY
jgi:hypothetical protein